MCNRVAHAGMRSQSNYNFSSGSQGMQREQRRHGRPLGQKMQDPVHEVPVVR